MKYWYNYTALIKHNCASSGTLQDLGFWRDNVFANIIIYLLPLCLIALLPGMYWISVTGLYAIACIDGLVITGIMLAAFLPRISILSRKVIFISSIYLFSCAILYYVGLSGPGLLYLFATCMISITIFPNSVAFLSAWLNTFISLAFILAVWLDIIPLPQDLHHSAGEWIAVSTNLIFLSFLLANFIPKLFNGLQNTLNKEQMLTEQLHARQQSLQVAMAMLKQKNIELEQFAYVASHDLKEPLRMVNNFMGLLKKNCGSQLDGKAHSYIGYAIDGGRRMQNMIGDLLDLSRTARTGDIKESVNLPDIVDEVKQNILKLIEETRAEIIVIGQLPVLIVIRADFVRLFQNLLTNAIKFRQQGLSPIIHISAVNKAGEWVFNVRDNGIGIDKENVIRIFDIFSRVHSFEAFEGTGIGLSVCKKVIEFHGGKIWVESEEGIGSNFIFTIKS